MAKIKAGCKVLAHLRLRMKRSERPRVARHVGNEHCWDRREEEEAVS